MWRAQSYAAQLPALARRGVKYMSFTGGEPLLARRQLETFVREGHAAGMECHITTACHWATSDAAAERVIASLPEITHWGLSTDAFHSDYVSPDNVIRAAKAAKKLGRTVLLRLAFSVPETPETIAIYERLSEALPGFPILAQPLIAMGRAAEIPTQHDTADAPEAPCFTTGMVVRFDGTVSPCCGGLLDTREGHPFQYGNVDALGLEAVHRAWCTDPVLQLIRASGFGSLMAWIAELAPEHPVLADTPKLTCEFCTRVWKDPTVGPAIRQRLEKEENRAKVAALVREVFGERFMLEESAGAPCSAAS
jgi:hypothetical protein